MNITHSNLVIKCQTKNLSFSADSQQNLLILEILHKFGHTKKLAKTDCTPFFECKEFLEGRGVSVQAVYIYLVPIYLQTFLHNPQSQSTRKKMGQHRYVDNSQLKI